MTLSRRTFGLVSVLILSASVQAAGRVATNDELQQMFDQKQYRACIQQSARVLALRGDAAKPYDLYTIHMRRGECFLNTDDTPTAILAFTNALSAADSPEKADEARAMILLIKASRGRNYFAKTAPSTPINIVDLDARKDALNALFTDKFAAAAKNIQIADNATSLVPIIQFIPEAVELHALEVAGLGKDPQTRPMLTALGEKARGMITAELKSKEAQIVAIQTRANQMVASGNNSVMAKGTEWLVADTRIGLSPDDRSTLREMLPYLVDIVTTSVRGKKIAQQFGGDGALWNSIIADAEHTQQHAQAVLDAE